MNPEKVVFVDDKLEKAFRSLKDNDPLKKSITKAIKDIQKDCFCGRNVKKQLIPRKFVQKYGVSNLWICNCLSSWRLIYSLTESRGIEVIAVVLDWMDHKKYERLFKF